MFEKLRKKKQLDELPGVVEIGEIKLNEEEIEDLKGKAEAMDEEKIQNFSKHYSEDGLWSKVKRYSKKIGSTAVYAVLLLYFVLQKEEVPTKTKAIIIGALGYFIFPIDLIPDAIPGVGYSDDIAVLLAALWQVAIYIDADVKNKAKEKLKDWFGDDIDTSDVDDKLV
ncbi:YkvA family protein [Solibacillus sp. FSL K6-1126]|uniref:YkvA family protein n=1 Tax=Solibacillus sp. FSL K6-1126 TaxID=2921463 RepID=UPI0030FB45BB